MSAAGIPSIGIGPGSERWAHDPEEQVPLGELVTASRIYANLIQALCVRE
jgi:acetylornithine deacetylase/succinyl-diaminopimelate desuccinylase-like protein